MNWFLIQSVWKTLQKRVQNLCYEQVVLSSWIMAFCWAVPALAACLFVSSTAHCHKRAGRPMIKWTTVHRFSSVNTIIGWTSQPQVTETLSWKDFSKCLIKFGFLSQLFRPKLNISVIYWILIVFIFAQVVLYNDILRNEYNTIQYNTIQYNTIQYNTIQYNTIQYNTKWMQYNTMQYNKIQKLPFGIYTTMELKKNYIRQYWHLAEYVSTNKCAGIVRGSCYILEHNHSINS